MSPADSRAERLRVLVRVLVFLVFLFAGRYVFSLVLAGTGTLPVVAAGLTVFSAAALANAVVVRAFEHGRMEDFGLGWTPTAGRELLTGILSGAAAATFIVAISVAVGLAYFGTASPTVSSQTWAALPVLILVLALGALGEELMFHGYAFQKLIPHFGEFSVVFPVGVVFGLAHAGNQNAGVIAILNTAAWGVLLGYAYLRTRTLWLPVGLHFGWNLAAPLLGMNMSGFTMRVTGYELHWRTSVLWSGGDYGIEGSLFTFVVVIALFFGVRRLIPD